MIKKDSNPKDAAGCRKPPLSTISPAVLAELGTALLEGHLKYGGYNWRAMGVRATIYYDACLRHLLAWLGGEDIDPDSGVPHTVKAMAGLVILRDAQINGMLNDDRPPKLPAGWMNEVRARAAEVTDRYASKAVAPFTEANRAEWDKSASASASPGPMAVLLGSCPISDPDCPCQPHRRGPNVSFEGTRQFGTPDNVDVSFDEPTNGVTPKPRDNLAFEDAVKKAADEPTDFEERLSDPAYDRATVRVGDVFTSAPFSPSRAERVVVDIVRRNHDTHALEEVRVAITRAGEGGVEMATFSSQQWMAKTAWILAERA